MATKKNWQGINPAAQILEGLTAAPAQPELERATNATEPTGATTPNTENATGEDNKKKIDRTGKRFNLSLYSADTLRDIRILAAAKGVSANELINIILNDYIEAHAEGVSRCREIFDN